MKRTPILSVRVVATVALVLLACEKPEDGSGKQPTDQPQTPEPTPKTPEPDPPGDVDSSSTEKVYSSKRVLSYRQECLAIQKARGKGCEQEGVGDPEACKAEVARLELECGKLSDDPNEQGFFPCSDDQCASQPAGPNDSVGQHSCRNGGQVCQAHYENTVCEYGILGNCVCKTTIIPATGVCACECT
jgi:hypothetical protein